MLADFLDGLGIDRPHVAGNSLGGWTALELAKMGHARSVVAVDPAGLWERGAVSSFVRLLAMRRGAVRLSAPASRLVRTRAGRALLLRDTIGRPDQVPPRDAAMMIRDLANASAFEHTLIATHTRRFEGGRDIDVPVTVMFGTRERIVPRGARRSDELPPHTRWVEPEGLGHVPMWDDPQQVAAILLSV
jgi:pimeloyl-ACP methyl ester carboxylesterase